MGDNRGRLRTLQGLASAITTLSDTIDVVDGDVADDLVIELHGHVTDLRELFAQIMAGEL